MQIQQRVLRLAAAAGVSMFLVVGAVVPAYATGDDTDDRATHSERAESAEDRQMKQDDDSSEESGTEDDGEDSGAEDGTSDDGAAEDGTAEDGAAEDGAAEDGDGDEAEGSGGDDDHPWESEHQEIEGPCPLDEFTKVDQGSGSVDEEWGSLDWAATTLEYAVTDGYQVRLCIKSGSKAGTVTFLVTGEADSEKTISQDISHIGYKLVTNPSDDEGGEEGELTCPDGSPLPEDGDCTITVPSPGEPAPGEVQEEAPEEVVVEEAPGNAANRAPAEVANAAGVLPDTGAGRYALPIIAGLALLGAGGVLLLRKRSRAEN